ncbi:uncharacterized protein LOC124439604 [Xenia sp. Carnegie-2017]|uniref:uncharacterized protein LOC124439604 n=1 Tax=Xenia sp. Carnegie-2017 TaxID=2897299 RepID=UPI001F03D020|nr:uncharacterized protein LOC124439604 [Xenia sp. Carnegie-2017]
MKEDNVATNEHDVATKENNVATKEDDLGSNENDVGSNENDVGLNENDVGSNENDVFMKEDDVAVGKKNTDKYTTSDLQPSSELDNMIVKNKEIVGEQDSHDTHDEISTVNNGCPEKNRNNSTELVEDVEITMSIEQVIHVINDGLYEVNDDSNENVALFVRDCVPVHCDVTKEHGVAIDDGTPERDVVPIDGVPEEECVAVDTIVLQKEGVLGDGGVPEEEHVLVADGVLQDESFPVDDIVSVEKHFPVNYDSPKELCAPQDDGVSENKYVVIDDGEPQGKRVQILGCTREEELVPANANVVEKFYPIGTEKRNTTVNGIVPRDDRFLLDDHFHEKDSEKDSDIFEKERVPKKKGVTINDGGLSKDAVQVNGSVLNKEYTAQHVDVLVLDGLPTEKNKRTRDINRISYSKSMEKETPITNRNIQCNSKHSANCEVTFGSKLPADSELSDDVELRDDGKLRTVGEPLVGKNDGIHKDSYSPSNISKADESTESFDKYESVNIFTEKEKSVKNAFSFVDKLSHKPFDDVRTELKKGKKDSDNKKFDPFKVSLRSMIGDKKTSYNKDVINHTSKPETVIPAKLSITSSSDIKSKVPPTSPIFTNENKQTSKQKLKKFLQKKIGFSMNLEKSSSQNKEKRCFEDFSKNNSKHLEDSENISKIVAKQLDACKNDSVLSRVKISLDNNKDCDGKLASCPRKRKVPSLNVSKESPKKRRKSSRIPKRKQYKEYKVNMRFKNNENFHNISNEDLDCRDDEFRLQLDESLETVCPDDAARGLETNPTNSQCFDVSLTSTGNERPRESVGTFIKSVETKPASRFTPVNRRRTTSRRSNPANQQSMISSSIQDSEPMRMSEISKVLNEFKDLAAEYTRSSSPIFDGEDNQCDSKVGIPGKISSTNDFTDKSLISHVSKFGRKRKRKRDRCVWTNRRRKKDKNAQINFERTNGFKQNEQLQTISERLDDLLAKQDLTQLPLIGDEINNVQTTDISLPTTSALKCRRNLRSFVDEEIIESSSQQLLTSNNTFHNVEFSNRHSDVGRDLKIKLTSEKDRHTGVVRWSRSFETREKESIEKPPSSNYGLRKSKTRVSKNLVKTDRDGKRRRMTISDMPSNLKSPDTLLNLSKRPLESYIKQIEDVHYSDKKTSKGVLSIDMKDRATKFSANTHDSCDYLRLGEFDVILEIARKTFRDSNIKNYRASSRSLYVAAKQGKVLQVLVLSSSCNVNATIPQEKHKTAMHAAAAAGHVQVLKILSMVGGNVSSFDTSLRTPLFDAVEHKKTEAVKFLINHTVNFNLKDCQGMTILHFAAQKSSVEIINLLLETRKVDINEQDNGGWTALMWTAEGMRKDAAECLLKWGANVNILDNEQNTCLHWAALAGDIHIMELLLNKSVHVDAKNIFDATALHISAREEKLENIKILSMYRPNLNIQDVDKKTPIELVPVGSPCHIQLKNMELLERLSKCSRKQRLISRDISRGLEKRPIPCINEVDDEDLPEHFVYVSNNLESQSQSFVRGISGCNCSDGCSDESACDCVMLSYPRRFWYNEAGLISSKIFKEDRPYVYECNMKCKCWSTCRQRVVQHGINVALQLFKTAEKGWAVRTQELIPKGTFVCEYIGEVLTDSEANQRDDDSYLFDLDLKGQSALFCLDAKFYGNITRFINHSCDPNILPVRVFTDHQVKCCPRIAFFAARDIYPYEEICSNYGEKFWTVKKSEFFCLCKTSKCKYGLKKDISGQSVKRMK